MAYLFKADLPYPKIEIAENNRAEVKILMPLYGGREGETNSIMSYIYGHYVTDGELSDCLRKLAVTEMHHHSLLGHAIYRLGGTPYIGGSYTYWQGGYVNYIKDPAAIINNALAAERQAIHDYKIALSHTRLAEIRLLIERIILDEEVHTDTLNRLSETYSAGFGK